MRRIGWVVFWSAALCGCATDQVAHFYTEGNVEALLADSNALALSCGIDEDLATFYFDESPLFAPEFECPDDPVQGDTATEAAARRLASIRCEHSAMLATKARASARADRYEGAEDGLALARAAAEQAVHAEIAVRVLVGYDRGTTQQLWGQMGAIEAGADGTIAEAAARGAAVPQTLLATIDALRAEGVDEDAAIAIASAVPPSPDLVRGYAISTAVEIALEAASTSAGRAGTEVRPITPEQSQAGAERLVQAMRTMLTPGTPLSELSVGRRFEALEEQFINGAMSEGADGDFADYAAQHAVPAALAAVRERGIDPLTGEGLDTAAWGAYETVRAGAERAARDAGLSDLEARAAAATAVAAKAAAVEVAERNAIGTALVALQAANPQADASDLRQRADAYGRAALAAVLAHENEALKPNVIDDADGLALGEAYENRVQEIAAAAADAARVAKQAALAAAEEYPGSVNSGTMIFVHGGSRYWAGLADFYDSAVIAEAETLAHNDDIRRGLGNLGDISGWHGSVDRLIEAAAVAREIAYALMRASERTISYRYVTAADAAAFANERARSAEQSIRKHLAELQAMCGGAPAAQHVTTSPGAVPGTPTLPGLPVKLPPGVIEGPASVELSRAFALSGVAFFDPVNPLGQRQTTPTPGGDPGNSVPPVAQLSFSPLEATVGQPVMFDGSLSTADEVILSYGWDFGDDGIVDSTTASPFISFTFGQPGPVTVRLVVTDNHGLTGQTRTIVNVAAAAPGVDDGAGQGDATLTLDVDGSGLGVVALNTGQMACVKEAASGASRCTYQIPRGTQVELTGTAYSVPAPGSLFTGWQGCDTATGPVCVVTMTADRNVRAFINAP